MITPEQSRAGRALAGATQKDLADAATVNVRTIMDFEKGNRTPIPATLRAIEGGLNAIGVECFPKNGGGAGVRFKTSAIE